MKEQENERGKKREIVAIGVAVAVAIATLAYAIEQQIKLNEFCGPDRSGYSPTNHPECLPPKDLGPISIHW